MRSREYSREYPTIDVKLNKMGPNKMYFYAKVVFLGGLNGGRREDGPLGP